MWKSVIAHIDADCFYVSCERARDPSLIGKPVAVLGNQGACVIAKSYELKEAGVKTGMPIWEAKKICPEAIYVKRDFAWYGAVSKRMLGILKRYSPTVEYYSIDEAFIDLTKVQNLYQGRWEELGLEIKDVIKRETGIPVSIGISLTRTLAKLGSDCSKPDGLMVLEPEFIKPFLKRVPVEELCGVGNKLMYKLHRKNIKTCIDYLMAPREVIDEVAHSPGVKIWWELHGVPTQTLKTEKPQQKIVSRGGSIGKHSKSKTVLWAYALRNLDRLVETLLKQDIEIKGLSVALQDNEMRYYQASVNLPDYMWHYDMLMPHVKKAFNKVFRGFVTYRAMHLIGTPIRSINEKQLSLFPLNSGDSEEVDALKRKVNVKHGVHSLRSAATIPISEIYRDKAQDVEICDIDGKLCF